MVDHRSATSHVEAWTARAYLSLSDAESRFTRMPKSENAARGSGTTTGDTIPRGPGVAPGEGRPLMGSSAPRSVSDQITDTLRTMLLTGQFLPDQEFRLQTLASDFGVSTMPVREALIRLASEGLVETSRGRSFRVVRITAGDIEDLYWLHSILAGELAARAARNLAPAGLSSLRDLHSGWTKARTEGDAARLEQINWEFHRIINHAAQAPMLARTLRNALRFIPQHFYSLLPEWPAVSERAHQAIIDALASGDSDDAREAAARHVRDAGKMLIAHFETKGYWITSDQG